MKKRLVPILMICLILMLCSGCKTTIKKDINDNLFDKFTVIEKRSNPGEGVLYIMYDNDTKVEYYYIVAGRRGALSPIYNADGTVKVYTETETSDEK